ncbi:hypothetical protein AAE478_010198 [Parahypoxylon ruwenzoriense]
MASFQEANFSQQLLYRWDPSFDSPPRVSDHINKPFVAVRDYADVALDVMSQFMQASDENDPSHYATDVVVGFCKGADFSSLGHNLSATNDLVALLDNSDGLTAHNLFQELTRPKNKNKSGHASDEKLSKLAGKVNRDIKRLYVTSLNRWTVLALAASSPTYQAPILGEFIFNHLQFDPFLNAKILSDHLPVFALEFHLPYFALRKHKLPQRDNRKAANGEAIRQYQDITFLRTMDTKADNSPTEYVYKANVSFLVSGFSCGSWSAYLFNDTYFQTEEDTESIEEYLARNSEGPIVDSLAAGKRLRDTSPDEPREYFLIIYEIHLRRVTKEWQQVGAFVEESIRTFKNNYWTRADLVASRSSDNQHAQSDIDRQRSKLREEFQHWMRGCVEFLRMLITTLDQLINEWREFCGTGINCFMSTDNPTQLTGLYQKPLRAVTQHFHGLKRRLDKLQNLMKCLCEDTARDVSLRIAHESNESALFQQKTARDVRILTWTTFLPLPITLATGLFSIQEGYLPITPSPWAFVVSIVVLATVIWLILGSQKGWGWAKVKARLTHHQLGIGKKDMDDIELRPPEGLS